MVYFTGDIHGMPQDIIRFCKSQRLTNSDIIVILGDVGANFFGDERDNAVKSELSSIEPTVLCVHGNHEQRPWNIKGYETREWNGGRVMLQPEYPSLLFALDGEIFTLDGIRYLVIGGAYSVDKFIRQLRHWGWWEDEQPSDEIKRYVENQIAAHEIDVVLSHTCPYKYEPCEMFLYSIDQSSVDTGTEEWLDKIEETLSYKAWYCGHWHIDKRIDKMHFLFHSFESDEWLHHKE